MPAPLSGPGRADLHLGQGRTLRPDTLMQTAQIRAQKPLADGAGHTLTAPFAVWLSMIAVVGLASRPAFSRTSTSSAWWMRSSVPSQSHRSRYSQTVLRGGRSFGNAFRWHPRPEHIKDPVQNVANAHC